MEWMEELSKNAQNINDILSFDEYLKKSEERPLTYFRTSGRYLKDMFDFYGKTEEGGFHLFVKDYPMSSSVYGQQRPQKMIYQNLVNFMEEGVNNKFILLVGPNGSAKTSLIRKIMDAAEDYSKTPDGPMHTFSWIFPNENMVKGPLGLGNTGSTQNYQTYAHLEDKEVSSILSSELRDHPILLLPQEYRQQWLTRIFSKWPNELEQLKKTYLYYGDISKKNRLVFDALLKNYQGDYSKVLKHIRVERYTISKRYSIGAVTIEPQLHVDATMQQITMDKRLSSLPPSLQSLNLFHMRGEVVYANRGIIEFSDLLKRPLDAFKYLLMTMESKTINMQGILTELDILFLGSSNEIHLAAFKQHPDFNSFKGRFNFIRVPYLLDASCEEKIYKEQIHNLRDKVRFEPHALETLCLWAVMSRLRPCQVKNYEDKKFGELAAGLSPLEKCLFLSYQIIPERFNSEEKQILKQGGSAIGIEFDNETLYEGKFGISPREMKQIIYEIASLYKSVTFVEILEYLTKFVDRKNEFDFLNMAQQGDYHHPLRFNESLRDHVLNKFDMELRDSLGLVDDRSYEEYIARYIQHISCLIKGEKIKNMVTGVFQEVDTFLIKEFESNVKLKEDAKVFRSHIMSALGAYSLDHPDKKIVYTQVFPNLVRSLKESFREEQKKTIQEMSKALFFFIKEIQHPEDGPVSGLTKEHRHMIQHILQQLNKKYSYSLDGALTLMKYLIKERY
jgi:serine protein kinase